MSQVITWPIPDTEKPFVGYELMVEGTSVPIWSARVREELNRPPGVGWTHMLNGRCEWAGFARFDFTGSVEVAITVGRDFARADILPRLANIQPQVTGRTIRFQLDQPRPLTLLLDGADTDALHLITHRPQSDIPSPDDPNVIYFGPGEHWINSIKVRSGQSVYLDGGAIVRAVLPAGAKGQRMGVLKLVHYSDPVIDVREAQDVRIHGRGILDGSLLPHPAGNLIYLGQSQRIRVEGITLRNSPNWHLPIVACDDVSIEGVTGISGRLNSDGINCVGSRQVRVRNCFMRSHDDTFAVKTCQPDQPAHNILYERCVAWNDWGYALGVTYETRADIHDVRYVDCDVIFARNWALGVHVVDGGTVENVSFERINIEYPRTTIAPELSKALVNIDNHKDDWATDGFIGRIRRLVMRDIAVRGDAIPPLVIHGHDKDHAIEDVRIEGLTLNGEALSVLPDPRVQSNEHVRCLRLAASASGEKA